MFSKQNFVQYTFYTAIMLTAVVGLASTTVYNVLPADAIFEALFFSSALILAGSLKKESALFFFASIAYVVGSYALMRLHQPDHVLDFLQAFKAFIYIPFLCFFYKREIFDSDKVVKFIKVLLFLFFAKYLYSRIFDFTPRMGERPGIFVENNFELIFLIILFFSFNEHMGRRKTLWYALLATIVLLSGSRSSMLALLISFCGIYLRNISLKTFFYLAAFSALTVGVFAVFLSRMTGGIESIDRFRFMMLFWQEISMWPTWKFFVGSYPITPLSPDTCNALAFYERLFSFSGDGTCYSVIFHSYFFRAIFDHGILGLGFLFLFIYRSLWARGMPNLKILCIVGVLAASALSVSAMNSIMTTLALTIVMASSRRGATP